MTTAVQMPEIATFASDAEHEILTPDAVEFLRALDSRFEGWRLHLMRERERRQEQFDRGVLPRFLPQTQHVRESRWSVAPVARELLDRRVEIAGPTDTRTIANALHSGASVFVADFEDAHAPIRSNCVEGQKNLRDANRRALCHGNGNARPCELGPHPVVIFVRPRGWHLVETHFPECGGAISGSLLDFGLYFFHNFRILRSRGSAPYFYLPKLESHLEARLWNEVFLFAQEYAGIPRGTIRATAAIETFPAAFEMDEILYELRDHSAGLSCGGWDYIFSFIKKLRNQPEWIVPQRSNLAMEQPFLRSYAELLIHTCHKRGIHAIGGLAAQIPIRSDLQENQSAMEGVRAEKLREVRAGFDGTWVAHPALVPVTRGIFDKHMKGTHQISMPAEKRCRIAAQDLLEVRPGGIQEAGVRRNIEGALEYIESWLQGNGWVPIDHRMEDAATAELCRAQLWQWIRHGAGMDGGGAITRELCEQLLEECLKDVKQSIGPGAYRRSRFDRAGEILKALCSGGFQEFFTTSAYVDLA